MSKFIKVSLIVIGSCILAGAILFGIGFNLCGGVIDFRYDLNRREIVSSGEKYVLELTELDDFKDIEADLSIGDLKFIKSDKFAIEYEYYDVEPEFSVDNGKLTVKTADQFFNLSFDFSVSNRSYMKIYYPDGAEFNDLSVDLSCGNLNIDGMNVSGKSVFDNSCGNVTVNNYSAKDVEIDLSSGNFSSDTMTVDTIISDNSCGDIIFNNLTCNTSFESINSCGLISVKDSVLNGKVTFDNSCGNVEMSGVSVIGNLDADLSCGDLNLQDCMVEGTIIGDLSCGDAEIGLTGNNNYGFNLETSLGDVEVDGTKSGDEYSSSGDNMITIDNSCGDIHIETK